MLLECESCGAPLDVAGGASVVRCHYCGRSASIGEFRTVSPQTPPGFVPPEQWTPSPRSGVPSAPLAYRPRHARRGLGVGLFMSLSLLALGGFVAWRITSAVEAATPAPNQMKDLVGQALSVVGTAVDLAAKVRATGSLTGDVVPVVCRGNDNATITGKTLSLAAGVPVVASGNCTLRLVQCTVSGATGIAASGNATVVVEGGSIAGKGPAVVLSDNATLDVSGASRLSGEVTITASGNAHAMVRNSSVSGGHVAVHTSGAAVVDTTSASVQGQVLAAKRGRR
jgi:LSD1 subclass zinc finger protein